MQARKNLPIECARRPTCSSEQTFRRLDKDPLVRPTELFFDINCNKYWLGFYRILQQLPLVSPHISQHCAVEITCNVRSCQSLCLFTRQSVTMSLVFQYQKGVFQVTQTYPSLNPSGAFPFERSTCALSAFALYPLALSGRLQRGLVGVLVVFLRRCFNWLNISSVTATSLLFRS